VALLAAASPGLRAQEQEPGRKVVIRICVVSGAGGEAPGASVWARRLDPTESGWNAAAGEGTETGEYELHLETGSRYRIRIEAPGHQEALIDLSPTEASILRVVLPVDPFDLPAIQATAPGGAADTRARTVFQARFATESLTYANVEEWLRDLPGVSLKGRGPGGAKAVSVRGSRPEDVLVLLDGIPLNDPLTGRANLSMIPTSTLESGTLLQGAASQRYGSGAGAGVLLLTSRAGTGHEIGAGVRMASYGGLGIDGQVDATAGKGWIGLSLSAERAENDFPYRVQDGSPNTPAVRTNADASGLHGALHGSLGPLFSSFRFDATERGVTGRAGSTLFDQARAADRSWIASTGIDEGRFSGSASYGAHRLEYRPSPEERISAHSVGELRLAGEVALPAVPATLGARATREAVQGDAIEGTPARTVIGGRLAGALGAGAVHFEPALSVDVAGSQVVTSPELGITWVPSARTRVWGRVGQGFRLPTFGDLYFASQFQLRPNPDLEPERVVLDAEIGTGLRTVASGMRLEAAATAWVRETENPIVWLSSSAALWSPRNVGQLMARGIEVLLEAGTREAATTGWRAQAVVSAQQSRVGFGTNRNPLPYEPSSSGRVSLEGWAGPAGARMDVRYTGPRTTSLAATRTLDGFTTLDLSARYQFEAASINLTLFGRLENLTDRQYQWTELYPEPGRHFTLRLEARSARR